jgi:anti-sigma B factor antagonist
MTAVVVAQGGELDIATIARLMKRLAPHRRPGRDLVLDLRRVTFMDCYALGHIIAAHADSATEGWTLRVRVETPAVLRLLELTGAARLLPFELPTAA